MNSYNEISALIKSDIDIINSNLAQKINLQEPILSSIKEFLKLPAKRIRPLIAILFLKANNLPLTQNHYKLLTATELVHNASLIHDDVIDDADLRRTKKTLNSEFNAKLAVIAGDYLLSVAMDYINELNNPQILQKFTETLAAMCKGEISQYFTINKIPTLEEYLFKTQCKTAQLFTTTLECSAILSGADTQNAIELGKNFGMAFQIKDDLNNILTTQSDLKSGIYTAPIILSGAIDKPAIEKTYGLLNNYLDAALKTLIHIEDNIYKQALKRLTEIYRK